MKLIDKDAVLAIIEKFMYGANIEADIASTGECFDEKVADTKYQLCKCIKGKINTLEVKEVQEPTASDRGMAEEIILNLKRVEQDYRINLTREIEWLRNQVKKGK